MVGCPHQSTLPRHLESDEPSEYFLRTPKCGDHSANLHSIGVSVRTVGNCLLRFKTVKLTVKVWQNYSSLIVYVLDVLS